MRVRSGVYLFNGDDFASNRNFHGNDMHSDFDWRILHDTVWISVTSHRKENVMRLNEGKTRH